jgi:dihydroflavonol-4-reductase
MASVLVTGGTGFLGAHTIARLLAGGHQVRTTVRSLARATDVRSMLATAGAAGIDTVEFARADLTAEDGWPEAVRGVDYVIHVASPFPTGPPKNEDEVIGPARDGALRVLRAAADAGVRRVVLTSSFAAVGYGQRDDRVFTEDDWTDVHGPGVSAYVKSKTLAERAAWDFAAHHDGASELAVINPVGIFGPVLGPDYSASIGIIKSMLAGQMRSAPPIWTNVVDVRDAADLHLLAMTAPEAAGQRYIAAAGDPISFHDISLALRRRLGEAASKTPSGTAPAWLIRLMARFTPRLRDIVPQLNVIRRVSNTKALSLGWLPRSNNDTVVASAQSIVHLGLLG